MVAGGQRSISFMYIPQALEGWGGVTGGLEWWGWGEGGGGAGADLIALHHGPLLGGSSTPGGGGGVLGLEKGTVRPLESGGCHDPRRLKKGGCPRIIL